MMRILLNKIRHRLKKKHKIYLIDIIDVDAITKTYRFKKPNNLHWEPGSNGLFAFSEFKKKGIIDYSYVRHMTILNCTHDTFDFTCRIPGSKSLFKKKLTNLKIGDMMYLYDVRHDCPLLRNNKHIVLLSMGVGIVTYKGLFEEYQENKEGVKSLVSINVDRHRTNLYQTVFDSYVEMIYTSNRSAFYNAIKPYLYQENTIFYIAGSEVFHHDLIRFLKDQNIASKDIIIDRQDRYRKSYYGLED